MTRLVLGFSLAALLSSGCSRPPDSPYPELVIDQAHNHWAGTETALFYTIAPSRGIRLSSNGYEFRDGHLPDSVQIRTPSGEYYDGRWDGKGSVVLDRDSLKHVGGATPFPGLRSGETHAVAIGNLRRTSRHEAELQVVWAGMIQVQ